MDLSPEKTDAPVAPSEKSGEGKADSLGITAFLILLAVLGILRLINIATSINEFHAFNLVEGDQIRLAEDNLGPDKQYAGLKNFFRYNQRYLPPRTQFQGILLQNNVLVYFLSSLIGIHYYTVMLAALLYFLLGFAAWSLFLGEHCGRRAQIILALLYFFPPRGFLETGLYLQGSHTEAGALLGVMFYLAFHKSDRSEMGIGLRSLISHPYTWLLVSFGYFFWLYKGMILFLPFLFLTFFLNRSFLWRQHPRQVFWAILLFLAGFVPPFLYHLRYGFYAHYLSDSGFDLGPTWFNVFATMKFRPEAIHLPHMGVGLLSEPYQGMVIPVLYVVCAIILSVTSFKKDIRRNLAVFSLVAFPLVQCLVLSFSSLDLFERYYHALSPLVLAVIAAGLSRLGKYLSWPVTAAVLVLTIPATLLFYRPDRMDLFLRYDAFRYQKAGVLSVPAEDIDWVNDWLDHCSDLRSPALLFWTYNWFLDDGYDVKGLEKKVMEKIPERIGKRLKMQPELFPRESTALGAALALRTGKDENYFQLLMERVCDESDGCRRISEGFEKTDITKPESLCATGTP